jgi:hypothetical protein
LGSQSQSTSGNGLSATRRRSAIAIRWLSLPLAAFVAIAPLWSLRSEYQRSKHLIPTIATVLDARAVSASRVTTEWEAYVRYPVRGQSTENSVRVWTHFDLDKGDAITLLVDPDTGDAEDDTRSMGWIMVIAGLIVGAFFLLIGFRQMGVMLRRDRELHRDASA